MCGADCHTQVAEIARKFLTIADETGSKSGRALATLILGEADKFELKERF